MKLIAWLSFLIVGAALAQTTAPSIVPTPFVNATEPPSSTPTSSPSSAPTSSPSSAPTSSPTSSPSESPTSTPTASPSTSAPTTSPTDTPTTSPSSAPSNAPTGTPTTFPTQAPTSSPSQFPTNGPTESPTPAPSKSPTEFPSSAPTESPTTFPSESPTTSPLVGPTVAPSVSPTDAPTKNPTTSPTRNPTRNPTTSPTRNPTKGPTISPTIAPTRSPVIPAPGNNDSPAGIIAGVVVALVFVSLLVVGFINRDKFIKPKPPGGGSDETKKQLEEYNKMTVGGAILGQGDRKSSTKTDGTEDAVVPMTGEKERTLDDFTTANSKLEMGTSSTLGRKQNASLQRAMESETGLIEPGQVANVNILLQGVDKERKKNLAIGRAQVKTIEKKKNPQAAEAVLPPKKGTPKPPPVTTSKKSPAANSPDLSILTSGKKTAAKRNTAMSKKDQEEFDAFMQPSTSNYEAKAAQGKELSLDDFMTGVATTPIPEDKEMSLDDFMTGVPQTTSSGVKRSPPQESTKKGVKGKATINNPKFSAEEPKEARPSSAYLTKAETEEEKHRSIFAPSESFIKSASEKRLKEKIDAHTAAPPPQGDNAPRPESAYLENVDLNEQENHKSIFRPSSLFLSQAKRDKAMTKKRTEEQKKKAAAAKKKFNIDSDI